MTSRSVLAMAAATRRVGYVYIVGRQVKDWLISRKAALSTVHAVEVAQQWINKHKPDVVITEKITPDTHKGQTTQAIIQALAHNAAHNYLLDISIERRQPFANKYEEAAVLARHFPELLPRVPPPRRFYDAEPRSTVLFEALALALPILDGHPLHQRYT